MVLPQARSAGSGEVATAQRSTEGVSTGDCGSVHRFSRHLRWDPLSQLR
jgi:hypothetical protein